VPDQPPKYEQPLCLVTEDWTVGKPATECHFNLLLKKVVSSVERELEEIEEMPEASSSDNNSDPV